MPSLPPLTILEEFLLLALDDRTGDFRPLPRGVFDCATAASVLMDLMKLRRVDCDMRFLFVISTTPINDDILDPVMRVLALEPVKTTRTIANELRFLAEESETLRERALHRFAERGIVKIKEQKILRVNEQRRLPVVEEREIRDVKSRVLNTIHGDDIPDPHDISLIALADACGLFRHILSEHELADVAPRIAQVARMDMIGQVAANMIAEIEASMAMSSSLR